MYFSFCISYAEIKKPVVNILRSVLYRPYSLTHRCAEPVVKVSVMCWAVGAVSGAVANLLQKWIPSWKISHSCRA